MEEKEFDLSQFLDYLKKNILVFILIILIVLTSGIIYSIYIKKPMYKSTTSIILATSTANDTVSQSDLSLSSSLVDAYTEIIQSKSVLGETINYLGLDMTYEDLLKEVSVNSESSTEILYITVKNEDAQTAKAIADEISTLFGEKVTEIYKLDNYSILDAATVAEKPYNVNMTKEVIIYIASGLLLALAYVFVVYYFDRNIKSIIDVENKTELPIMGSIRDCTKDIDKLGIGNNLLIKALPDSNFVEDIKTIRTNLSFSAINGRSKTILITSSMPGEGKSFVSSNLAASFAQNNKKVILVDCDLRKGVIHKRFHVDNMGLSNLIANNDIANMNRYITPTEIHGLDVITRGVIPPNPSELLSSSIFKSIISALEEQYDYVILDGTPITNLPDSLIVSHLVDKTLIVASMGITPMDLLMNTVKSLKNVNAPIAGVIVNRLPIGKGGFYGSAYKYKYSYKYE